MSKLLFSYKWFTISFSLVVIGLFVLISHAHPVLIDREQIRIQDFAYYLTLTDYWWKFPGNIYDLSYQINVYSSIFGLPIDRPMPVLWSPLTLLVFAPLLPLLKMGINATHAIWITLSVGVALWGNYNAQQKIATLLVVSFLLFLPIAVDAAIFGQIAIIACGLFGALSKDRCSCWLKIIAILILAIKPTFLFPAFLLLLARREWKVIGVSSLLLITWLSFVEARSGFGISLSYYRSLSMFSAEVIPEPYVYSVNNSLNVNSLMFFRPFLGWQSSYLLSMTCFCLFQLSAFIVALKGDFFRRWQKTFLYSMCGYMLFSPYLGWYEELLLIPVILSVMPREWPKASMLYNSALTFLCLILCRPIEVSAAQSQIFFLIRTGLFFALFFQARSLRTVLLTDSLNPTGEAIIGSNSRD